MHEETTYGLLDKSDIVQDMPLIYPDYHHHPRNKEGRVIAMLSVEEVKKHSLPQDAWIVIDGQAYDVSSYLDAHPGGKAIILQYAGKDATKPFRANHSASVLRQLPSSSHLGPVQIDSASWPSSSDGEEGPSQLDQAEHRRQHKIREARRRLPRLKDILNLQDMERVAHSVLTPIASAYYQGGSDTEASVHANQLAFLRYFFNPRVLRRVDSVDPTVTILGRRYPLPIIGSAVGNSHMAGPDCDFQVTKGLAKCGLPHMVSTYAATSILDVQQRCKEEGIKPNHFLQLYVERDHDRSARLVQQATEAGANAVFITVDVAQIGNRERDREVRAADQSTPDWPDSENRWIDSSMEDPIVDEDGLEVSGMSARGSAATSTAGMDRDLNWQDLEWIRNACPGKPILLKGIQCVQDALLAVKAGVDGIVLSNHGGRQMDFARPPIDLLYDLGRQHPEVLEKMEVYIDGGIRRGTDVLKALCLGARAVSLGRPLMYAEAAYGHLGVVKVIRILEEEILTGMRLLGAASIAELKPDMVERVDAYAPMLASVMAEKARSRL